MPLKKLDDDKTWNRKMCRSPEHKPPSMMVYPPGLWEWTCPACGEKTVFSVPLVTCLTWALRKPKGWHDSSMLVRCQ